VFREGRNFIDETGKEYSEGRLVVAGFHTLTKRGRARWLVLCRPCNVTFVVEGSNLRNGQTTRCPRCYRARKIEVCRENAARRKAACKSMKLETSTTI
jgi:uncharacterized paraquat-inducible protein A